jgi:hypothetical protein
MNSAETTVEVIARAVHAAQKSAPYPWWHVDAEKCRLAPHVAQAVIDALAERGLCIVDAPLKARDRVWIGISTNHATVKSGPMHRVVLDRGTIVGTHEAQFLHRIAAAPTVEG